MVSNVPHALRYASFMGSDDWKENLATRARPDKFVFGFFQKCASMLLQGDMKPSLPNVLEVYRLAEDYKLEKVMPPVGRNSQARDLGIEEGSCASFMLRACHLCRRCTLAHPLMPCLPERIRPQFLHVTWPCICTAWQLRTFMYVVYASSSRTRRSNSSSPDNYRVEPWC